jgi:hypothetical protein
LDQGDGLREAILLRVLFDCSFIGCDIFEKAELDDSFQVLHLDRFGFFAFVRSAVMISGWRLEDERSHVEEECLHQAPSWVMFAVLSAIFRNLLLDHSSFEELGHRDAHEYFGCERVDYHPE